MVKFPQGLPARLSVLPGDQGGSRARRVLAVAASNTPVGFVGKQIRRSLQP